MDKVIIATIADKTSFMSLSFQKYPSIKEFHVLLDNNLIYDFIKYLAHLTYPDQLLDKSEYLIFSCIGLNNEHPLSFFDVTEGEFNAETDELFDVERLPLTLKLWFSLLYSILEYWLSADAGNI